MKNKNIEQLNSFTQYCNEHPEMRFWQALRNWNMLENPEDMFILTASDLDFDKDAYLGLEDTFYREK